jgi:hypothetical protein
VPAKPSWLLRVPYIIEHLRAIDIPVIDRRMCERLFQVKRRRAIALVQFFGGYRSGNAVLVDRNRLIAQLATICRGEEYVL